MESNGGNDIHCDYKLGDRRLTAARMRGDFDHDMIQGLLRSFLSAAQGRSAVGYTTRLPIRIPFFFE